MAVTETAFHGTSTTHLPRIFAEGLRSTHETRIKNFGKIPGGGADQTAKTRGVYQTDNPKRAFGISQGAVSRHKGDHTVVVSHVHPREAQADEDYHEYVANNLSHAAPRGASAQAIREGIHASPHYGDIGHALDRMPDHKVEALHEISHSLHAMQAGANISKHYADHYAKSDKLVTPDDTWKGFGSAAFPGNRPHHVAGAISVPKSPREKPEAFHARIKPVHELMTTHRDNPEKMFSAAEKLPGVTVHRNPNYGGAPVSKAVDGRLNMKTIKQGWVGIEKGVGGTPMSGLDLGGGFTAHQADWDKNEHVRANGEPIGHIAPNSAASRPRFDVSHYPSGTGMSGLPSHMHAVAAIKNLHDAYNAGKATRSRSRR